MQGVGKPERRQLVGWGSGYRPLSLRRMAQHWGDPAVRRFVALWVIANLLVAPTGMLTRWLEWTGLPISMGGVEVFVTVYLPLLFCIPCVLWFGYLWSAVPAYVASALVAWAGGMPAEWILLFAFANPLGLAVYALAYSAIPMRIDLRSLSSCGYFAIVSFVSALISSSGAFLWAYTNDVGMQAVLPVWQGWWLGNVLQAVVLAGPLLYLAGPSVLRWRSSLRAIVHRHPSLSRERLLATFGVLVMALSGYILLVRHFTFVRLADVLSPLGAVQQEQILKAVEGLSFIHLITILLLVISGIFGYEMVVHWTKSFREAAAIQRRLNGKLETEIEERRRMEVQLREQTAQLKHANDSKDRFFSIISHDLRSPVSALLAVARTLRSEGDAAPPEVRRELVELLNASTEHVYDLLDNLLTWARLQANDLHVEAEPVEVTPLAEEVLQLVQQAADGKGVQLHAAVDDGAAAFADPNMLRSVLLNLLSNAIKFTGAGGRVALHVRLDRGALLVSVVDTGVGMSREQQGRLFQVGTAHSTPGTDDEPGAGLGLILCREMLTLHDAALDVVSAPGEGTTFSFRLPLSPARPGAAPPLPAKNDAADA